MKLTRLLRLFVMYKIQLSFKNIIRACNVKKKFASATLLCHSKIAVVLNLKFIVSEFWIPSPHSPERTVGRYVTFEELGLLQIPDVYGVYQFKVNYHRLGLTRISTANQVDSKAFQYEIPVRRFRWYRI